MFNTTPSTKQYVYIAIMHAPTKKMCDIISLKLIFLSDVNFLPNSRKHKNETSLKCQFIINDVISSIFLVLL